MNRTVKCMFSGGTHRALKAGPIAVRKASAVAAAALREWSSISTATNKRIDLKPEAGSCQPSFNMRRTRSSAAWVAWNFTMARPPKNA